MSAEAEETPAAEEKASGLLGAVERIGNKVPHPVLMFAYLIVFVIVLSWGLSLAGVSITEQIAVPVDQAAPTTTTTRTRRSRGSLRAPRRTTRTGPSSRRPSRSRACSPGRGSGSSSRPS
ncbi:AbgT family transporter [Tessaracoccus defluvii]|uniref:AbgT family transporter n=1 Tax=Tessaracoccus defluvii TaxID=1285901 RepID=UPI0021F71A4C|nr:AbgT family transporter [Tessaracoccus defluvii]